MYVALELYLKYMFNDPNHWLIIASLFHSFKVKWINCDLPKYYLWYRKLLCRMKKKNSRNKPKHVWTIYVWRTVFLFNDLTFLCLTKNLIPLNQYAACKSNLLEDSNFIQGVNQLTIDKKIHGLFVNNIPISIIILILCRKILPLFSLPEAVFGDFLPLKIRIWTFYFSASNVSKVDFF